MSQTAETMFFKARFFSSLMLAVSFSPGVLAGAPAGSSQKIYSKHWLGSLPAPQGGQTALLIHDIFISSYDLEKKLPQWTAYHLSPAVVWGGIKAKRDYISDPLLSLSQSLSAKDYKGASNCDKKGKGYSKGHLAPVGSFKASPHIYQAQYMSNIVPQAKNLNQGPWRSLEERARAFVKKGKELKILTGPLYGGEGKNKTPPCWKAAQGKLEEIPSSYWKIIAFRDKSKIKVCAFLMPQKAQKKKLKKYAVSLRDLEKKTGLSWFEGLKKPIQEDCQFLL